MKLSVIVVNYNSARYLVECVRSVYDKLKGYGDFEVLVIDNNSRDDSLALLENAFPHGRVLKNNENLGFVKGANQGIANTEGEYVFLLNPDTKLLDKNIPLIIDFMDKNPSIGICGLFLISEDGSPQSRPSSFSGIWDEIKHISVLQFLNKIFAKKDFIDVVECDCVFGPSMLIRRAVFKDAGLFDENIFMFAEEEDICFSAKKKGWKIYFYPFCKVIHYGRKSSEGLEEARIINHRMSALYYYSKRYNRFFMILIRMIFLINIIMRITVLGFMIIFNPFAIGNRLRRLVGNLKAAVLVLEMKDSRSFKYKPV